MILSYSRALLRWYSLLNQTYGIVACKHNIQVGSCYEVFYLITQNSFQFGGSFEFTDRRNVLIRSSRNFPANLMFEVLEWSLSLNILNNNWSLLLPEIPGNLIAEKITPFELQYSFSLYFKVYNFLAKLFNI